VQEERRLNEKFRSGSFTNEIKALKGLQKVKGPQKVTKENIGIASAGGGRRTRRRRSSKTRKSRKNKRFSSKKRRLNKRRNSRKKILFRKK